MWDKYLGIIGWEIDVIVICVELKIKYSKKNIIFEVYWNKVGKVDIEYLIMVSI